MNIQYILFYHNSLGKLKGQSVTVWVVRSWLFSGLSSGKDSKKGALNYNSLFTSYFILIANMELEAITS